MNGRVDRELPRGWAFPTLAEVAQINPPLGRCVLSEHIPVTFVPMRVIEVEGGGIKNPETRLYGRVKKGYTVFRSGDVIMAKITPCMENGKTAVVSDVPGDVCFGSTELHVVRPEKGIVSKWIKQFLSQYETRREAQRQMVGGVGQMRVPANFLKAVRIPIAPSEEQSRIANALDELFSDLDAGVAALERVRDQLKLYRASVLKAAVEGALTAEWRQQNPQTEPAEELLKRILIARRRRWEEGQLRKFEEKGKSPPKNWKAKYKEPVSPDTADLPALPAGWCWAKVAQCSSLIQYGSSAKTSGDVKGVPVLRMGNLTSGGRLVLEDLKRLPLDHEEFPNLLLENGDVLFNRTNSAELVGKTAVYSGSPPTCSFASYLIRVRMLEGVSSEFLTHALNGGLGRSWIKSVANQTVGQANVNGTKLAAFVFPLPPVEEQEVIVGAAEDQLSTIDHLESELRAKTKTAQGLRQAILRHAFTGKLVPQDLTDEPAVELLKHIATERAKEAAAAKRSVQKGNGAQSRRRRSRGKKKETAA